MVKSQSSFCLKPETGTYVFAVINLVFTVIATILCVSGFTYLAIFKKGNIFDLGEDKLLGQFYDVVSTLWVFVLVVFWFISVPFAVLLMNGVIKRKPDHIKAYFIYGVVVSILVVLTVINYLLVFVYKDPVLIVSCLTICFLYSLILIMIRKTYQQFEIEVTEFNHASENVVT